MYNSKPHMRVVSLSFRWEPTPADASCMLRRRRLAGPPRENTSSSRAEMNLCGAALLKLSWHSTGQTNLYWKVSYKCLQQACQTHFHLEPYRRHGCPQRGRLWIKLFKSNHSLTLCCRLGVWILPYLFKLPRNTQKQAQNLSMHHINEPELLNPKNKHKQTS